MKVASIFVFQVNSPIHSQCYFLLRSVNLYRFALTLQSFLYVNFQSLFLLFVIEHSHVEKRVGFLLNLRIFFFKSVSRDFKLIRCCKLLYFIILVVFYCLFVLTIIKWLVLRLFSIIWPRLSYSFVLVKHCKLLLLTVEIFVYCLNHWKLNDIIYNQTNSFDFTLNIITDERFMSSFIY